MEWIKIVAVYIIPIGAFIISVCSLAQSRKVKKLEEKINKCDLRIKEYEIEKIEKEKQAGERASVEARIVKISNGHSKLKVWNSGGKRAYNIDYEIPAEYQIVTMKEIVPYEYLDPGNSFEENVVIHYGSSKKYMIETTWDNEDGTSSSNEQLRSFFR